MSDSSRLLQREANRADLWSVKSCGKCGAAATDTAIKCPNCRSLLVAPPAALRQAEGHSPQWGAGVAPPPTAPPFGAFGFAPSPTPAQRTSSRWKRPNWKWWAKRAAATLVALLVYSAFHAGDGDPYSHKNQQAFVHGCTKNDPGNEPACRCMIGWIKQNVPAADYKAYGHLVTSAGYTHAQDPPWVMQAARACVGAA